MRENEYKEAATEVLDILNHIDIEDVRKIPQSFIKFLTDISKKGYNPQFNYEYPINCFNLNKKTRELLGFIYITWWCNQDEREKYKRQIRKERMKKQEVNIKYNLNDMFKRCNL